MSDERASQLSPSQQPSSREEMSGAGDSRSPEWYDDDRRKRRRSTTPPQRRDQRRDNYQDRYRDQSGMSRNSHGGFRGGGGQSYQPRNNEPPQSLPYLVSQSYFQNYMRQARPSFPTSSSTSSNTTSADATQDYNTYRADFLRKGYRRFFDEMKEKAWFLDKYGTEPALEEDRQKRRRKGREGRIGAFLDELEEGKLANLSMDFADYKAPELLSSLDNPAPETDEAPASTAEPSNGEAAQASEPAVASEEQKSLNEAADAKETPKETSQSNKSTSSTAELVYLSTSPNQLFIKAISNDISRAKLEEHCAQVPGFDYLAVTDPNTFKNSQRVGWASFKDASDLEKAKEVLCESTIANFTLHMVPNIKAIPAKVKLTPGLLNDEERIVRDLETIRKVVAVFEKEEGNTTGSEAIENQDVGDKKKLDLYLHYLRTAFHTCYYCVVTCDFAEELERKCPKHLRRDPTAGLNRQKEVELVSKLDDRMPLLLQRGNVDPGLFGGISPEEEINRLCEPKIKQEDEGKYRCLECKKLFSALRFVQKHITGKHPEIIGDSIEKLRYFNNFVLDPGHPPHGALEPVDASVFNNRSQGNGNHNLNAVGGMMKHPNDRFAGGAEFVGAGGGFSQPYPTMGMPMAGAGMGMGMMPMNIQQQMQLYQHMQQMASMGMGVPPGMGGVPVGVGVGGQMGGGGGRPPKRRRDDQRGPPPPPPGATLDPRARRGASSYADLDGAPSGVGDDIMLPY